MGTHDGPFYKSATRALGFVDCDPLSRTAGCADRGYWHYQDGKGFAVGSFQVVMFGLEAASQVFADTASADAFSFASELACEWWAKRILADGLLDEYFAHQKSFCASAYTVLSATLWVQARVRTGRPVSSTIYSAIRRSLDDLIADRHRPDAANQTLAARIAWDIADSSLGNQNLVRGENPFVPRAAEPGWLYEYGGFDLGYSLKCVDLCALALSVLENSGQRSTYEAYAKGLISTLHRLVVHHTFAPILGSRGNPHLLIGGLGLFATKGCQLAPEIRTQLLDEQRSFQLVTADSSDDKYFAFFHLNSLLLSHHAVSPALSVFPHSPPTLICDQPKYKEGLEQDELLGILFYRFGSTRLAVSSRGSAAVRLESEGTVENNSGYVLRMGNKLWGPGVSSGKAIVESKLNGQVTMHMPIRLVPYPQRTAMIQNPWFHFFLQFLLGLPVVGSLFRNFIYASVVRKKEEIEIGIRKIVCDGASVSIRDEFTMAAKQICEVGNWTMVDGHATRLHSQPTKIISKPFDVAAGSLRTILKTSFGE